MKKLNKRKYYIKNPEPKFNIPKHYKHTIPFVIKDTIKKNKGKDFTSEIYFYLKNVSHRCRRIYVYRRKALNAMLNAILYHVNIVTKQVPISATNLTKYCGLDTISKKGNKSITRGTRTLTMLRDLGLINYSRCFDKVKKRYLPSEIKVTSKLLDLWGVSKIKLNIEINNKLKFLNKKYYNLGQKITSKKYSELFKINQYKKLCSLQEKRRQIFNKQKMALKFQMLIVNKGEYELKHKISKQVSQEFLSGLIPNANLHDLRIIVNKRINIIKKIAKSLI